MSQQLSTSVLVLAAAIAFNGATAEKATPESKRMQTAAQLPEIDVAASKVKTKTATFALG